jgi:hypothetical protein
MLPTNCSVYRTQTLLYPAYINKEGGVGHFLRYGSTIFRFGDLFFGQRQHKIFRRFAPKKRYGRLPCVMYRVAKKNRIFAIFRAIFCKKIFFNFAKMTFLGVILCEKSIARVPEA